MNNIERSKANIENYENLINAIVVAAADDYKADHRKLRRLKKKVMEEENMIKLKQCKEDMARVRDDIKQIRNFFLTSPWVSVATSLPGNEILSTLDKILKEEEEKEKQTKVKVRNKKKVTA